YQCSSPPEEGIVLSSTSGTLRTNSRSPPLSVSPMRGNDTSEQLLMDQMVIDNCIDQHCDGIGVGGGGPGGTTIVTCNACPPMANNTINTKGILKYNKNSPNNHTMTTGRVKCAQTKKCCVSCHYVNTMVPELRYDPIGVETADIPHEYCDS
ncbi:unnamed protein product, partial [Oppiella nova]